MNKICNLCKEEKPISAFREKKKGCGIYRYACRKCEHKENKSRWDTPEYRASAKIRAKRCNLKREYNLDYEVYLKMIEEQESKCLICKVEMQPINVDHCHTTGKVRGLLCMHCNNGLGAFKDNINNMKIAIQYLETHSS